MFAGCRSLFISCAAGCLFLALPSALFAQPVDSSAVSSLDPQIAVSSLPDAPAPLIAIAANQAQNVPNPDAPNPDAPSPQQAAPPASGQQTNSSQTSSSAQTAPVQADSAESKRAEAEKQMKQEEQQRVLGILPSFNISYLGSATVSLSAKQKMSLAFHSVTDPAAFGIAFMVAGYRMATRDNPGFPNGIKGYGERSGTAYLDAFDGNMLGNGILPAILHQDPRYYRLGHGSITHRLLYSLATNVVARHDNTGKWEPNYSNIGGNIIGGALSNFYYPGSNSAALLTITNGFVVTGEGAVGSVFEEFWPDISRKFLHKDPTHGLDAQMQAADEAKKQSKNQGQ